MSKSVGKQRIGHAPTTWKCDRRHVYAVITGDIVGSSSLAPSVRRRLPDAIQRIHAEMTEYCASALPTAPAVFSGDSWQILLDEPMLALRVALFFRASLRAQSPQLDSRLAIGIGHVTFVPHGDVAKGDGEAFRLSGRLLSVLGDRRMGLAVESADSDKYLGWESAVQLLDVLATSAWTASRARAISGALRGWPQDRIRRLWRPVVSQAAVSKHLSAAHWGVIKDVLGQFERPGHRVADE